MTRIESKKVAIGAPKEECFAFLSDMNNYQLLLPKSKISDWKSDEKKCSFKIQKAYKLELAYQSGTPYDCIRIVSGDSSPFKFTLDIFLKSEEAGLTAQLICDANINSFLKMMVEKPLNNLFDYMAERLSKVKG